MVDRIHSSEQKEFEALSFLLKKRIEKWHYQPGVLIVRKEDDKGPTIIRQKELDFKDLVYPQILTDTAQHHTLMTKELNSLIGQEFVRVSYGRTEYESRYKPDTAINRLLGRQRITMPEHWEISEVKPIGEDEFIFNEVSSLFFLEGKKASVSTGRNYGTNNRSGSYYIDATLQDLERFLSILPEPPSKT